MPAESGDQDSNIRLSVIVCTHNPRAEYLGAAITALRNQSLAPSAWELLLVDNASRTPVPAEHVSWHPAGRVLTEPKLGLTHARLRGIQAAKGELLVWVDDDNILDPAFLATVLAIARQYSHLGAFGGQISPRFESAPPEWAKPYLQYLALVEVTRVHWSNASPFNPCCPCGAGLCVRRDVALVYAQAVRGDPWRQAMDRIGDTLNSGGDTDLALTACDQGLGVGLFPQLRLEHLIPTRRLELDYLCALVRGNHRSQVILAAVRGAPVPPSRPGRMERLLRAYQRARLPRESRMLAAAIDDGRRAGQEFVRQYRTGELRSS